MERAKERTIILAYLKGYVREGRKPEVNIYVSSESDTISHLTQEHAHVIMILRIRSGMRNVRGHLGSVLRLTIYWWTTTTTYIESLDYL
jgi:hypothetical protein